ncbi:MAG TPA: hypothetical protein VGG39_28365 [Polyangiaceae bacterium]|jgi:hypothetical protein
MNGLSGTSSFRVGERLLAWSDDGLLVAEYTLFDPTEIVLHASDPVTVREAGYMTTARQAIARLAQSGVTAELATTAADALLPEVVASFARGPTALSVASELGAQELFDGAIYRASSQPPCYEGAWLDLRSLVQLVGIPDAPVLLQSLHLAATLVEVPGDTPLHLSTVGTMRSRRPGERTHLRPSLKSIGALPEALRRIRPRTLPMDVDPARDARLQPALLARVRERLSNDAKPRLRTHLTYLERTLSARSAQSTSPVADEELRAIERQIDAREMDAAAGRIRELAARRGDVPAVRYLQARLELLRGEEPPRAVAAKLSEFVEGPAGFHRATLVTARTWLAAGETAEARRLANRLVDDAEATDSERLVALEILDSTPQLPRDDRESLGGAATVEAPAHLVGLGDVPPPGREAPGLTARPPPLANASTALALSAAPRAYVHYDPEIVESLKLPSGSSESDLAMNARPRSPAQARIAMVRLARDLARDYRLWYGKSLRCDVIAIDSMQQHLLRRYAGASITEDKVAWELRRHGALVSEILARKLGGSWVDVGPSEPGYWAMLLGSDLRTRPIGRVYRYVSLGAQQRDLVGYFIELEQRVREA